MARIFTTVPVVLQTRSLNVIKLSG